MEQPQKDTVFMHEEDRSSSRSRDTRRPRGTEAFFADFKREKSLWRIRNQRYHAIRAEDARNAKKMESDVYKDAGEAGRVVDHSRQNVELSVCLG